MQIKTWIDWARHTGQSGAAMASQLITGSYGFVQSLVGRLPLLGSAQTSKQFDEPCDEKHYLVIPYRLSEVGYSLYVLRCLPEGAPPINDLPKRRVFHLPHANGLPLLQRLMVEDARQKTLESPPAEGAGESFSHLADRIDQIEGKVFYGLLAIGGLVALANPVVGATIAAKSLLPSLGLELSRFGLKSVGDAMQKRKIEGQIRAAEKDVRRQFQGAEADSYVNPLLEQLELALNTTGRQYRPEEDWAWDSDGGPVSGATLAATDRHRWVQMTRRAVANVYEEALRTPKQWDAAALGPEDIVWLQDLTRDQNKDSAS